MTPARRTGVRRRRGSSLIEFAFVSFMLMITALAAFEFSRMIIVYTTVANAARISVRYAIVHGATRTGTGVNGPSGPGATTNIENVVKNYADLLNVSQLSITVTYPDTLNTPGSRVAVTVTYLYDPFTTFLPLRINLGSKTQGVIAF